MRQPEEKPHEELGLFFGPSLSVAEIHPAQETEVVAAALELGRPQFATAEELLHGWDVLTHQLSLQVDRICRDDHAFAVPLRVHRGRQ